MHPISALLIIIFSIGMLVFFNYAYAELEIDTLITDDLIIISGFFDEDSIGIALKQNGMLIDTARGSVENGHYFIEIQKPKYPGIYELLVGSATNNKSIQIFIDVEIPLEEIEIEDLPYSGKVGPIIIEPIIEEPDEPMIEPLGEELLPSWIKDVFVMWTDGLINDLELIEAINYLIKLGVIEV